MVKKDITKKPKKSGKRKPSEYNKFMARNIGEVKKHHPDLSHQEAFKKVAAMWSSEHKKK